MMTDYKPGTVAVATVRGVPNVRVFRRYSPDSGIWHWAYNPDPARGLDYSCDSDASNVVTDVRPLVVLDLATAPYAVSPDDEDAVTPREFGQWLRTLGLHDPAIKRERQAFANWVADQIEAQSNPPRIPEPGLWGVVEGRDGNCWVRVSTKGALDWAHIGNVHRSTSWDGIGSYEPLVLIRDGIEGA